MLINSIEHFEKVKRISKPKKYICIDYHVRCHDCGQFLKRAQWVRKDHEWKKHALCLGCLSNYD